MDQFVGSNKLATFLHPNPTDPFLELKTEPENLPSPSTSPLLQHNPSLIGFCTFNSLYQRLVEPSSPSNTLSHKPFLTSSDLYFHMPPVSQISCSDHSNGMLIPSSNSVENNKPTVSMSLSSNFATSPISLASESCPSTPVSNPQVNHITQQISSNDPYVSQVIVNKCHYLPTSCRNSSDNTSNYELSGKEKFTWWFI
jgi:hypothetical protein